MKHSDISIRIATREDVGPLLNLLPQITSRPQSFPGKTLGLEDSIRVFGVLALESEPIDPRL